jgi:hypothetical protein
MSARSGPLIGAEPAHAHDTCVHPCGVASTAGGGWNSHIPSPGGAMERGRVLDRRLAM